MSLTTRAKATASNVFGNQAEYGPDKAVDGRDDTRWATDASTTSAWLEVDLGKPTRFSRATILQAFPELSASTGSPSNTSRTASGRPVTGARTRANGLSAGLRR